MYTTIPSLYLLHPPLRKHQGCPRCVCKTLLVLKAWVPNPHYLPIGTMPQHLWPRRPCTMWPPYECVGDKSPVLMGSSRLTRAGNTCSHTSALHWGHSLAQSLQQFPIFVILCSSAKIALANRYKSYQTVRDQVKTITWMLLIRQILNMITCYLAM